MIDRRSANTVVATERHTVRSEVRLCFAFVPIRSSVPSEILIHITLAGRKRDHTKAQKYPRLRINFMASLMVLGLLEFNDLAALVSKGQFMAKTFPFANDDFPFYFAFLVELIDMLN